MNIYENQCKSMQINENPTESMYGHASDTADLQVQVKFAGPPAQGVSDP